MYNDLVEVRNARVDDVESWVWIKTDHGAFDGPAKDWVASSRDVYLKYTEGRRNTVIQAGGNCGMYPRLLSTYFDYVYTFEPDPLNFFCLTQNCQEDRIVKIQAALGQQNKLVSMLRYDMTNVGQHAVSDQPGFIPMFALDTMNFHNVDFIQLDVEHHESQVILGAMQTINRHKPILSLELGHQQPCRQLVESLGYELAERTFADALFVPRK